jgi:hypothetical protein
VVALEAQEAATDEERAAAARRVYEKLLLHLSPLIGAAGARGLLARSARLSASDFPSFASVDLSETPAERLAEQLVGCLRDEGSVAVDEGTVAVCATMLTLLATMIGERLTLQVVRSAWPAADTTNEETE